MRLGPSTNFPDMDNSAIISAFTLEGVKAENNAFYGAEDIDFSGDFEYCMNANAFDAGKIGDADCKSVINFPEVQIEHQNYIENWLAPYASNLAGHVSGTTYQTEEQNNLYKLISGIRWTDYLTTTYHIPGVRITIPVSSGQLYKLQIILWESCCSRWENIYVNDKLIAEDVFTKRDGMGVGQLFNVNLLAESSTLVVRFWPSTSYYGKGDNNPIWNALTLERL